MFKPLKTLEEIRETNRKRQARFYQKRKEVADQFAAFPIPENEFIHKISERVIEGGKPMRVVRLVLLLSWAKETGVIR